MSTEHTFARYLKPKLRERGLKVWKINDTYEGGVPDYWVLGTRPAFFELKQVKELPKRDTTIFKPDLSALQLDWLISLYTNAHLCACVIRCGNVVIPLVSPDEWNGVETATIKTWALPQAIFADNVVAMLNNTENMTYDTRQQLLRSTSGVDYRRSGYRPKTEIPLELVS